MTTLTNHGKRVLLKGGFEALQDGEMVLKVNDAKMTDRGPLITISLEWNDYQGEKTAEVFCRKLFVGDTLTVLNLADALTLRMDWMD